MFLFLFWNHKLLLGTKSICFSYNRKNISIILILHSFENVKKRPEKKSYSLVFHNWQGIKILSCESLTPIQVAIFVSMCLDMVRITSILEKNHKEFCNKAFLFFALQNSNYWYSISAFRNDNDLTNDVFCSKVIGQYIFHDANIIVVRYSNCFLL